MSPPLTLLPIGGCGEFGRNLTLLFDGDLSDGPCLAIDCGARIAGDSLPGIDLVLPDLAQLAQLGPRLLGYALTHGHEDHVAALPYALRRCSAPVLATRYTLEHLANRLEAPGMPFVQRHTLEPNRPQQLGPFVITAIAVSHSIPGSIALCVQRGDERVVFSGDYREDHSPVHGPATDTGALDQLGELGVTMLVSDSTGALEPGHNPGERSVRPALDQAIAGARGRVIVATFPSHANRVRQLLELAIEHGRQVAILGRSAKEHLALGQRMGELVSPPGLLVDEGAAIDLPPARLLVVATGCQGEPNAALTRMALGARDLPPIELGDRVVLSARVIPGNETGVLRCANEIVRRGADLVMGDSGVHVSGHGYQDDLKALIARVRPALFVPVHGDRLHLQAHADLAEAQGLPRERIALVDNGQPIEAYATAPGWRYRGGPPLELKSILLEHGVPLVDGESTISERRLIGRFGVLCAAVAIDPAQHKRMSPTVLSSLGYDANAHAEAMLTAQREIDLSVDRLSQEERADIQALQEATRLAIRRAFRRHGLRAPPVALNLHVIAVT